MNWSGGKDSSLCLWKAGQQSICPEALLTTVNKVHQRVSMHGVRTELLKQQAASLGLPLHKVELPEQPSMEEYEEVMNEKMAELKNEQFTHALFGDIFLEDLKNYREQQLARHHIECLFPLWLQEPKTLMQEFLSAGFKAIVVCVNTTYLDKSFCGRLIDDSFVADLPPDVDVCGERGEYHSFVFDGPIFNQAIPFQKGETVYQEYKTPNNSKDECFVSTPQGITGFYFCDLLPR